MVSRTIWKFPLRIADTQLVPIPSGARLLHVGIQGGQVCLWAEVSPDSPIIDWTVRIYGTGHPIEPNSGRHVGTFMLNGGAIVFHAYA